MSLGKGIQSAIFYYISCAPCTKCGHRRKRKQEANRVREERRIMEMEEPELFRQPSPFSTNPHWQEDMTLGPGPPPQRRPKGASRNGSQRALTAGDSMASSAGLSSRPGDSLQDIQLGVEQRLSGENWNRRRYQREDEDLWGSDVNKTIDEDAVSATQTASSVGLSTLSRSGTSSPVHAYTARNPPLNDYHPPVVSSPPTNRNEMKWMLQPPPNARIMNGKERATTRSRSGSGASSQRVRDTSLSRQVGEKILEEKVRRGEKPESLALAASRETLHTTDSRSLAGSERSSLRQSSRRKPKPPQISIDGDVHSPLPIPLRIQVPSVDEQQDRLTPSTAAASPAASMLSSILPTTSPGSIRRVGTPRNDDSDSPIKNTKLSNEHEVPLPPPPPRAVINDGYGPRSMSPQTKTPPRLNPSPLPRQDSRNSNSSLNALQELVAPSSTLNRRSASPLPESLIRLPPATDREEVDLLERWLDTRLPKDERGRTTVMARWSLDV
ncbi:hypothetical protein L228DRAFT_149495 [Xylona heveae TC161]|uniref:Uncharacterized protein n=1 Tax=Xylona heveae (strain CBS 132557 / TC161) TaxID=1328760 RepID=A0A165GJD2_XYLHT|nr:hypothetical protein L228DRAFT_149495 [Xylona heveae TC161]KZF22260.1 hypothetical protein L228DRAFT_149495 [Xylona heveae TC161]